MKRLSLAVFAAFALSAGAASAEVVNRSENGFTLTYERAVTASDAAILEALGDPAAWWSDAHTYSGSAANLSVDLRPGGCWCEALPGGGVKHAETLLVWPAERMVSFDAPFGPLRGIGADAVLTVSWDDGGVGGERTLKWKFVVAGPGAGAMADAVDTVTGEQFGRLADHLSGRAAS
jgi:hypothetical protein